jgi:hypothetical protein
MGIQGMESFLPPDPLLDHSILQAGVHRKTLGTMQPLEALWVPERIQMSKWSEKRANWQEAVTLSLILTA